MQNRVSVVLLAVQGILSKAHRAHEHGLPFTNALLSRSQPLVWDSERKENSLMAQKEASIFRDCSQCKQQVVISYDCKKCGQRICMLCAVKDKWKCPRCNVDVLG